MANLLIWWRQRTPSEQRLLLDSRGCWWYAPSGTDCGSPGEPVRRSGDKP